MIAIRNGSGRRARLAALGAYVPERRLTNADLEKMVDTSDEWIVTRTGIHERRIAEPDQSTADLATLAAEDILRSAGITAQEVDVVMVPSATPGVGSHGLSDAVGEPTIPH